MASAKIPKPLDRRHLLQRDTPAAQSLAIAQAYLAEDRRLDAVDFLAKAKATSELEAMLEQATEEGDAFLVRAVSNALGSSPEPERWQHVAAAAEAAGKKRYADTARRQAEVDEDA